MRIKGRVGRVLGTAALATLLASAVWSGVASAQDTTGGTTGTSTTGSSTTGSSTTGGTTIPGVTVGSSTLLTTGSSTTGSSTGGGTTIPGITVGSSTLLTTGSSTTTTGNGTNTQTVYQPYPVPVIIGDYGHRFYGKYYDNGCGCDRYAAKNYTPQTVVATQVASVPKGGVDTGDGSFN